MDVFIRLSDNIIYGLHIIFNSWILINFPRSYIASLGVRRDKLIKAQLTEKYKITIIFILLVIALFLTCYFHAILETGIIFTHFFYIPIILAAIWWKRKGLVVAILLILVLFLGVFLIDKRVPGIDDMARAFMFLVISSVVIILSEKISKNEELLQKAHDELNLHVKERTFELTISNEKLINEIEERKHAQEELNKLNALLEQRVRERTAELENKNSDLETMLKAFVGRELRMVELKKQIARLEKELPDNRKSARK